MTPARILSYKAGFLRKLAEAGVLPSEAMAAVKVAAGKPEGGGGGMPSISKALGQLASLAPSAVKGTAAVAVGAPLALGAGAGALDAVMDAPVLDADMLHKMELMAAYRQATKEILNRQAARKGG